ncbi:NACHT, LRR and PYD domains-containing protein 12-like [Dendronephthya gigantea]|uniref:NACHT, LRR and PYD domains-containing protein 12-like n=1 Tax=Dendronephthya gigantea TaxID=151771 RepID=UPI00106A1307|nr:NACHT, LRR and PYD domains-containing protein 12-like [Dendronephthya gigantea]
MDAYPDEFDRQKIYNCHLETPRSVTKLTGTADLFKPVNDGDNQTYPRTILVIGRPGIGKTMLTRKLLHQWKENEGQFWQDKIIISLQFRVLNNKTVTLREMLRYGAGLTDTIFKSVYYFILTNPTNVVLVFDGLDELNVDGQLLCSYTDPVCGLNDKMPVFSIFRMLIKGKLLKGVTVLTTSRPTAGDLFENIGFKRTVEILGFFHEEIKEYVFNFCKDDKRTGGLIWNQIQNSAELCSLCYVPVNSYIACLTLKESIEFDEMEKNAPKTITELYNRAVKVLMYRHHPRYKLLPRPNDYLISPYPRELDDDLKKLKQIAMDGIRKGRLIFERKSGDEFGELANCGLFNKLPDKRRNYFCFLHLTLQEFLAASKVVDDGMQNVEEFLEAHIPYPKWYLVIQFVAGLVGDKIKSGEDYSGREKILDDIVNRFEEWVFKLESSKSKMALLGIKCLYEMQDINIMKSVSGKFLEKRHGELHLKDLIITPVDSAALFIFFGSTQKLKRLLLHQNCKIRGEYSYRKMEKLFVTEGSAVTFFQWRLYTYSKYFEYFCNALKSEHCQLTELRYEAIERTERVEEASDNETEDELEINDTSDVEGPNYSNLTVVGYLSKALESENCKLIVLHLVVTNGITDYDVKCLCEALNSLDCKLTELHLSHNRITSQGVKYLSEVLKTEPCKLTQLYLDDNKIKIQGVEYLIETLRNKNCKLTRLSLNDNKITDQGVECLNKALTSENCKLTELNLSCNNITDSGVKNLSEALKNRNCKLTALHLNNNKITDQGVECLDKALTSENCKLTELNLSCINITDSGVKNLSEALKNRNCKLTRLSLNDNKITDQGVECLNKALTSENCKLTEFEFTYNVADASYIVSYC